MCERAQTRACARVRILPRYPRAASSLRSDNIQRLNFTTTTDLGLDAPRESLNVPYSEKKSQKVLSFQKKSVPSQPRTGKHPPPQHQYVTHNIQLQLSGEASDIPERLLPITLFLIPRGRAIRGEDGRDYQGALACRIRQYHNRDGL